VRRCRGSAAQASPKSRACRRGFDPSVALLLGHPAEQPVGEPRAQPAIHWL